MTRTIHGAVMFALVSVLAIGCGGTSQPSASATTPDIANGPKLSPFQERQNAACEALGPKITQCAIDDAKATMTPEKLAELKLDQTAPINTKKFIDKCEASQMSSRQLRVHEVCFKQETECAPLLACLDNAKPQSATPAK